MGLDCDFQLGADPIGRGDDQRIIITGGAQVEQGAKTTEGGLCARTAGRFSQRLDGIHQSFACVDIDSGRRIG